MEKENKIRYGILLVLVGIYVQMISIGSLVIGQTEGASLVAKLSLVPVVVGIALGINAYRTD